MPSSLQNNHMAMLSYLAKENMTDKEEQIEHCNKIKANHLRSWTDLVANMWKLSMIKIQIQNMDSSL